MNKTKLKILKILTGGLCTILIILVGGYLVFNNYYSKMNIEGQTNGSLNNSEIEKIDKEMQDATTESPEEAIKRAEEEILRNLKNKETKLVSDENVFNILLIGSDHRGKVAGDRSDSMIVLSINKKTKELTMTSFMRDCYVQIPGYKNNRLNAAYSYGGAGLLIDTIEQNFKIDIDRYAKVDFIAFANVIDAIGGVDMEISEAEMQCINDYMVEYNNIKGLPAEDGRLEGAGNVHLGGKQALSYARIRYVGNADFGRTERQRKIMQAAFNKCKTLGIIELNDLFNKILPEITTDLTQGECISLLLDVPQYKDYNLISNRVPYDGTWEGVNINKMSVLSVDFEKNISRLQQDIYHIGEKIE